MKKNDIIYTLQGLNISVAKLARDMGLTRQAFRARYTRDCSSVLLYELMEHLDAMAYKVALYREFLTAYTYEKMKEEAKQNGKNVTAEVIDIKTKKEIKH